MGNFDLTSVDAESAMIDDAEMLGMRSLGIMLLGLVLTAGCRTVTVIPNDADDGDGNVSAATATGSGVGGAGGGPEGVCPRPPAPTPGPPPDQGCATNDGSGWVSVPCDCELWMVNVEPGPITAGIELTTMPADQVPSLGGPLDVEMVFPDEGGGLFDTWSTQAGNGTDFALTHVGSTTTVRLGRQHLLLDPVPIAGCTTEKANASISGGGWDVSLQMHAVLSNGELPVDARCQNPPPTSP